MLTWVMVPNSRSLLTEKGRYTMKGRPWQWEYRYLLGGIALTMLIMNFDLEPDLRSFVR